MASAIYLATVYDVALMNEASLTVVRIEHERKHISAGKWNKNEIFGRIECPSLVMERSSLIVLVVHMKVVNLVRLVGDILVVVLDSPVRVKLVSKKYARRKKTNV